jgi:hypothetical protein
MPTTRCAGRQWVRRLLRLALRPVRLSRWRLVGVAAPAPVRAHTSVPTVQSFGRLGGLEIGVIDVPILNQAGQALTLLLTPPGASEPTWTLTVLEQVRSEPHARSKTGLGGDTSTFPEIRVAAFLTYPGNRHSGYFALAQPTSPTSDLPSVFFVSDFDGTVTQITQAEYAAGTAASRASVPPPPHRPPSGYISCPSRRRHKLHGATAPNSQLTRFSSQLLAGVFPQKMSAPLIRHVPLERTHL